MSFRFASAAATRMALAVILATMVGCGDDDCTKASDHFSECLGGDSFPTSGPRCEEHYLCVATCVNSSDCATLKAAFNPADPQAPNSFLKCQAGCASAE